MCDYCNSSNNLTAKIPILDVDLDCGILGKARVGAFIKNYNNVSYIDMTMNSYGLGGRTVSKLTAINFCPMCGRQMMEV